ncbi:exodeoxyribonuclease V subunit alpha [Thalassotalea sp. PS06]|uniref:exodeoxyribonuclease V subunit alpha n=1 Tax=Thalassotalea sp. PS06 TaxID=2594005 RepID=UPI0011633F0E|nr:exodeoxyribonuclease V subunit alpha [Thalassotalea sp. PS06]QDP01395.1 exodeoxyribonuclease V subunit alpha [Thalassotalea sp. PS06]
MTNKYQENQQAQQSFLFADEAPVETWQHYLDKLPNVLKLKKQLADIEAIDYFLAKEILATSSESRFDDQEFSALFHLFVALSQFQRQGHTCLPLATVAGQLWFESSEGSDEAYPGYVFAELAFLDDILARFIGACTEQGLVVVDNQQLYLRRYWRFETELADVINHRLRAEAISSQQSDTDSNADSNKAAADIVQQLFPHSEENETDWQKVAVANALNKSFSIIAGGPGTGKTYTVTKLIAAIIMQSKVNPDIKLVAPTGKAAQRLSESIAAAVEGFRKDGSIPDSVLDAIPLTGLTLHRLLGVIPNSPNFRHHQDNPLSCDVVIVDEVSMVDLPLMTRLFRALPEKCKVVLLGDCQQLPSVETGSVLADLATSSVTRYSVENANYIRQLTSQNIAASESFNCDYLTYLTKSRRFQGSGGIGLLAKAIIDGDSKQSWQLLTKDTKQLQLASEKFLSKYVQNLTQDYYREIFLQTDLSAAYAKFQGFRILTPSRSGEGGIESLNEMIEQELQSQGFKAYGQTLYRGRPIMITQNHYKLQLFNGDIGMIWPDADGNLKAHFPDGDQFRSVSIPRLPPFETVFAMTIHKTQGSEFASVAMVIPEKGSTRLLSRELIYTGLTRAKSHFQLFSRKKEFIEGIEKRVSRCSGLGSRIQR